MKKIFKFILTIAFFLNFHAFANEIEVIELHQSKSLDQLVFESINNTTEISINENDINEENISISDNNNSIEENENSTSEMDGDIFIEETNINEINFWESIDLEDADFYLSNSSNITSKILYEEFLELIMTIDLDYNIKKNRDLFYLVVSYLYKNGEISKANKLINQRNFDSDEKISFYKNIEMNYLLSTYNLEKVCEYAENISDNVKFEQFFLEKVYIFCLILNNQLIEADLQNSIMIETEKKSDDAFQKLYEYIVDTENKNNEYVSFKELDNSNLIFLYSAMLRIAELPLNRDFLELDYKNLAIPIILNNSSPISLRLQAANKSYMNDVISIESLAALYRSVDFESKQFNNPTETIEMLSNNTELSMAFLYQLMNIQIFPTERLEALISFWEYAEKKNLSNIAFGLTEDITKSLELSSENSEFGIWIANAHIFYENYDEANKWLSLYNQLNGDTEQSIELSILINIYTADTIETIVKNIELNLIKLNKFQNINNNELFYIILNVLSEDENLHDVNYSTFYDDRPIPTLFILNAIKQNIIDQNKKNFLLLSTISLNNKSWIEIHPEYLKLLLNGFKDYKDISFVKKIILDIFKSYDIL
tara:strand:- start:17509 stop:19305 length:1797 start_codon:yes stop_codon:yes gene_type:complete